MSCAGQAQRRALSESTSKKFREQMAALAEELDECAKHYVRCIRPNGTKDETLFNMDMVLRQLRFFGLLDIVKIRRLQGRKRVIQRLFNVGVLEAMSEKKASTL